MKIHIRCSSNVQNDINRPLRDEWSAVGSTAMQCMGFMAHLGALDERHPSYRHLVAGLLVIEIATYSRNRKVLDVRGAEFARRRASAVTDIQTRTWLLSILANADPNRPGYPQTLDRQLKVYGVALHQRGCYGPAADVFAITADAPNADPETRMQAMYWRAFGARLLSKLDEADMGYSVLRNFAERHGDKHMELEAILGQAKVAINRGNIPDADEILNRALKMAEHSGDGAIGGKAHIDLAYVAGVRRRPADVIEHSRLALRWLETRMDRDRALRNIAVASRELGRADDSARIAAWLAKNAEELDERIGALTLMYNLAVDAGDFAAAGCARADIARMPLTPKLAVEFHEGQARHFAAEGRFAQATRAAEKMLEIAEEHSLNEYIFRGDVALLELKARRVPAIYEFRPAAAKSPDRPPLDVEEILSELPTFQTSDT
jgi:tetratricopeptide (TPR) repeat protein